MPEKDPEEVKYCILMTNVPEESSTLPLIRGYTTNEEIAEWWIRFPKAVETEPSRFYRAQTVEPKDVEKIESVSDLINKEFFIKLVNTGERVPTDNKAEGGIRLSEKTILTWERLPRGDVYVRILEADKYGVYGRIADLSAYEDPVATIRLVCNSNPKPDITLENPPDGNVVRARIRNSGRPVQIIGMLEE